jgi:hypothetical protein
MTRFLALFSVILLLGACQLLAPRGPTPLPPVGAAKVAIDRAHCTSRGGRFDPIGKDGSFMCFRTPADAGKMCNKSSDCSTACLANSHSCAPITPLVGCQDILDGAGQRVTQCIN